MEEAIKRAVAGGYINHALNIKRKYDFDYRNITGEHLIKYNQLIEDFLKVNALLDPLFWQALGTSLGWGNEIGVDDRTFWSGTIDFPEISDQGGAYREVWRWQMHRFIDHLAEGGKPDQFFTDLLGIK